MNARLAPIGLRAHGPADEDDYGDRLQSWLDSLTLAEFGEYARDFFELHKNSAHYDAFVDQMQPTFDRVCK